MTALQIQSRSFTNELNSLSQVLLQAGQIASSLQELHDMDMCEAMTDINSKMQKLEHQLATCQPAPELPNQNFGDDSSFLRLQARGGNSLRQPFAAPLPDEIVGEEKSPSEASQSPTFKREGSCLRVHSGQNTNAAAVCFAEPVMDPADSLQPAISMRGKNKLQKNISFSDSKEMVAMKSDASTCSLTVLRHLSHRLPKAFELPQGLPPVPAGVLRESWDDAKQEAMRHVQARCDFQVVNRRQERCKMPVKKSLFGLPSQAMDFTHTLSVGRVASSKSSKGGPMTALVRCCRCLGGFACGVLNPVGPTRFHWNGVCLLFILYDVLMVPMQVFDLDDVKTLNIFEWILTIWWTVDVFMTFRTGYIVGARIEMRFRQIAIHYSMTWLFVDLLVVTLEWVNRFASAVGSASLLRSSRALRAFRFLKLLRVTKMMEFGKLLQEQINSNAVQLCITLTGLGLVLLILIHLVSCAWYALGKSSDDGWLTFDAYQGEKTQMFWYVASYRWVVSQFNGRTDMDDTRNMGERLFTCTVGVLLAVFGQSIFISIVTKTMLDLSELVSSKTRRRRNVNAYLEANPLSPFLTTQIKRCLIDYQDSTQELKRENDVLEILPIYLQLQILYEVRCPVLVRHHFFNGLRHESPAVMRLVCWSGVTPVSAAKDEVVFDKGQSCDRMLFVDKVTGSYGQPAGAALSDFQGSLDDGLDDSMLDSSAVHITNFQAQKSWMSPTFFQRESAGWLKYSSERKSHEDLLEYSLGFEPTRVAAGSWISEAALWIEWENKGRFVSSGHGVFIAAQASKLAPVMRNNPDIFAIAVSYAKTIAMELSSRAEVSDILPFEVHVHSPMCVRVTIVSASGLSEIRRPNLAGWSDLYCLCKVVGGKYSEVRFKTGEESSLEPVWDHTAEVLLSRHQLLEFQVCDHDAKLGSARLDPEEFSEVGIFEGELDLRNSKGQKAGSVSIRVAVKNMENEWEGKKSLFER